LNSDNRLNRMREYLTGNDSPSLRATYFGDPHCEYYRSNNKAAAEKKQSTLNRSLFCTVSSEIEEE